MVPFLLGTKIGFYKVFSACPGISNLLYTIFFLSPN